MKKKTCLLLAVILTITMLPISALATTTPKPTTPEGIDKYAVAYQTELESIMLLQNKTRSDGSKLMLPLNKTSDRIAIFGRGRNNNITGSTGSGTVAGAFSYTFLEGLSEIQANNIDNVATSGNWTTNTEYPGKWGTSQQSGTGWNRSSPIQAAEQKYADATVATSAVQAKTAVVFLLRQVGTEEMDRASNPPQPSDWYLNPSELTMLAQVANSFDDIIIVASTAGSFDMTWTDFKWMQAGSTDYYTTNGMYNGAKIADASAYASKIKAVVWSYGSGGHYGLALAQLMYGDESFSAKLADTITYDWYDHFSSKNFGGAQNYSNNGAGISFGNGANMGTINGPLDPVTIYQEDVYLGHRYFDTFMGNRPAGEDPVLFPFGFGLTYANFAFSNMSIAYASETVTVNARITNTAGLTGKEVMEVYVSSPNDKTLDQPYQKLVGYAKTGKLAEGAGETLSVKVPINYIASYDESRAAYVLEEGNYIIRVGNSSRNTAVAGILNVSNGGQPIIVEQLKNRVTLNDGGSSTNKAEYDAVRLNSKTTTSVTLKRWDGTTITLPVGSLSGPVTGGNTVTIGASQVATSNKAADVPAYVPGTAPADKAYTLQAVKNGTISLRDFAAQMTEDELVPFLSGGTNTGPAQTYSDDTSISLMNTANALSKPNTSNARVGGAGSSRGIQRLGIPSLTYADGSAGISISAAIATALGTDRNPGYARAAGIACTWNPELQYDWGVAMGKEMLRINVDILLAPSINLHRNPLNGRNTEYYSEEPFLSGSIAANVAVGVADQGVTVCLKHFAGNDQEQYRRGFHTAASVAAGTSKDAINSIMSERALREVTLRPFEMAVKTGKVRNVMSAFNKINGQFAAASDDILTNILRGEWGFNGYVVCDWGDFDEIAHAADEMRTGNDMIMSGTHNRYSIPNQIWNGLRGIADYDGLPADPPRGAVHPLTRADLERNAFNVLSTILQSPHSFDADGKYNTGILNGTIQHQVKRNLSIQTTRLPTAIVGLDYRTIKVNPLLAAGNEGTSSYTFTVDPGSQSQLPAGMTLLGNGFIAGAPAAGTAGTYNVTFRVTDGEGNFVTKALSLTVRNIVLTTTSIGQFRLGVPFDQTIGVNAGGPVAFSVVGTLPTGISLDAETGRLSGNVAASDVGRTFNFAIRATASAGADEIICSTIVRDYIDVVTTPSNNGITLINGATSPTIATSATRGISGDAFVNSLVGALPTGMSFSTANRNITGTPREEGIFPVTIVVSLSTNPEITVRKEYVIEVVADPDPLTAKILTETLPYGKATVAYSASIVAAGGTGTRSFAIVRDQSSPGLPASLAITSAGVLSFTPGLNDSGLYKIAIRYTMGTQSVIKVFDLYIDGALAAEPVTCSTLTAYLGKPFVLPISVSGGFAGDYFFELDTDMGDALPAGLTFVDNGDFTAMITGAPAPGTRGEYDIAIYVNETFAGSPVDTVIYYKLVVTPDTSGIDLTTAGIYAQKNYSSGKLAYAITLRNEFNGTNQICVTAQFDAGALAFAGSELGLPGSSLAGESYDAATGAYSAWIIIPQQGVLTAVATEKEILKVIFDVVSPGADITGAVTGATVTEVLSSSEAEVIECVLEPAAATTYYAPYDMNGDGKVTLEDISLIIFSYYGAIAGDSKWAAAQRFDVNGDGVVDIFDLMIIMTYI